MRRFVAEAPAPVNILRTPRVPSIAELGVARVSWGGLLQRAELEHFEGVLASLAEDA